MALLSSAAIKQHYAWRKKLNKHAPRVMARIFSLRGKMYSGCGGHYALEKRAGVMLARLNNFDTTLELHTTILDEVFAQELLRDLVSAERSARAWNRKTAVAS